MMGPQTQAVRMRGPAGGCCICSLQDAGETPAMRGAACTLTDTFHKRQAFPRLEVNLTGWLYMDAERKWGTCIGTQT